MGKWVHRLSMIDPQEETAFCEHCGPVRLKVLGPNRFRCSVVYAQENPGPSGPPRFINPGGVADPEPQGDWTTEELWGRV